MATSIRACDLPRLSSTRDGRDRVDLVTEELFDTTDVRADRITYHPGDTAAAHFHRDCEHVFFILEGCGILHVDGEDHPLTAGDVAHVQRDEVHWFSNPHDENFTFIEIWAPAPSETIWVDPDDVCTWAATDA